MGSVASSKPQMKSWEKALLGVPAKDAAKLIPGFLAAAVLAWISIWLADFIGTTLMGFSKSPVSSIMMALLLGLIIGNVFRLPGSLQPGLTFSVKKLLRLGIILLGIRLSILDVFRLGALGVPIVAFCIAGALFFTTRINKWLKLPERLGTLIAVGTSICGVSAIVATGPAIDAEEEEVAYAVAVITIFGLLATLVYPYVANLLFAGDAVKAGLFLGTSIHDTSQVTGSAFVYSEVFTALTALDTAVVTKLVRNVFMALVIPFMAYYYTRRAAGESGGEKTSIARLLPQFVLGFVILAMVRSIGDAGINAGGNAFRIWDEATWTTIHRFVKTWAGNFMVVALAGVGLKTRLNIIKGLGIKPFLVGLAAALMVGLVSFIAISLLGSFVAF
jgi:uncharacterized integral membrane protein (TIGR00698 family)